MKALFAAALSVALAVTLTAARAQSFAVTDIGVFSGASYSYPNAINDSSGVIRIVGHTGDKQGNWQHGFYWDSSTRTIRDMRAVSPGTGSNAVAVNSRGEVVGWASTINNNGNEIPVYWNAAAGGPLVQLPIPTGSTGIATGINDSGVIVGTANGVPVCWSLDPVSGQYVRTDLPLPAGSLPTNIWGSMAINAAGSIAGWTQSTVIAGYRATVWHVVGGTATSPVYSAPDQTGIPPDEGGDWSLSSCGFINDVGLTAGGYGQTGGRFFWNPGAAPVVFTAGFLNGLSDFNSAAGESAATGRSYAFDGGRARACLVHSSTGQVDNLGILSGGTSSQGNGINSSFQVVGWASTKSGLNHAFLWSAGLMKDLNNLISGTNPFSTLTSGDRITNSGNITGQGTVKGYTHAYLLKKL